MASESESNSLNLYTAGPGLFDTHVTWEDVENSVQKAFNTKAIFGAEKTVKNIGEGNGFLSRICLIEPDWQNVGGDDKLPNKFVVKICTAVAALSFLTKAMENQKGDEETFKQWVGMITGMEGEIKGMHNNEVKVYALLKKYGLFEKMALPKIYYLQNFTEEEPLKGHIIMEHMDNLESVHIYTNLPIETVKQPLRSIAAMEAASLHFTDEEKAMFKSRPFKEFFGKYYGQDKLDMYIGMIKGFGKGKLDKICEKITENVKEIANMDLYDALPEKLGMRPVLCQGDMWSTNILWTKAQDQYKMEAIVDFQTAHFGAPTLDLCRLLCTSLSPTDRREHWESLLETFYGYLTEELNGEEAPYTLENLKSAYRIYFPMAGFMILPMIGPLADLVVKNPDVEERERINKIVFEKTDSLLQDMVEFVVNRKL